MTEHVDIPDDQLHEPKGISTAAANTFYVADGEGSGTWEPVGDLAALPAYPVGAILDYAGTSAPDGWAFCYGQVLQRAIYIDLFSIVGTTYGAGDGSITFNVPDCRGRVSAGLDNMGGTSANRLTTPVNGDNLGATGGSQTATLVAANIPELDGTTNTTGSHTHGMNGDPVINAGVAGTVGSLFATGPNTVRSSNVALGSAGAHTHTVVVNEDVSAAAHNNVQPTIILNKIIFHGVFST